MTTAVAMEQELEQRALTIPQQARALIVRDQDSLDAAGRLLTDVIKPLRKEAASVFDPIIVSAHKAHRDALAGKSKVEAPLIEAEAVLKRSVGGYLAEQECARQAEEDRLRREAHAREREALRVAEERRQAEERALNEQIEREHAEEVERQIEALGSQAAPEEIAALCQAPAPEPVHIAPEMPIYEPVPVVARSVAAPAGISTTTTWSAEVTSMQLLCRAIADGKVPAHYVSANMTVLNGMARANKQALNIPGVRAVPNTSVSARSR